MFVIDIINGYRIESTRNGFRVTKDDGSDKHTHLQNLNAAKNAVKYVVNKKIPKKTSNYYLTCLIRLSNDDEYINKIQSLIDVRKNKGKKQFYFNPIKK